MTYLAGINGATPQAQYSCLFNGGGVAKPQQQRAFRGGGAVTPDLKPDTVEISAKDNIESPQKKGMSTGTKWTLGITGTVVLGIIAHKFIPLMQAQDRAQKIFLQNFSKEEAKTIQKKYNDILKIQDKDEFIDKLFKELRKDYKLDDIPIHLNKNFKSGEKSGAITAAAHTAPEFEKGYFEIGIDRKFGNEFLLQNITHELRHVKQYKFMYQASTKKEIRHAMSEKVKDLITSEGGKFNPNDSFIDDYTNNFVKFFDKLNIGHIDSTHQNYEWARKVLDSSTIYANKSQGAYSTAFYEADAKATGKLMVRFAKGW